MSGQAHGAVAYFDSPKAILEAAYKTKAKGMQAVETYTPFPVHGMNDALGIKLSIVPWATLICGLGGFTLAHALQIWTSAVNWPINVGGKPFISYPAFIPIIFELTVLLGALGTVAFTFFLMGMPSFRKPIDPRLTDDRFALYVPFSAKNGSEQEVQQFLNGLNPERVALISEPL